MTLYHYTSKAAFDKISSTGQLLPTDPWTTMDKTYGHGWYFTDLAPHMCGAWTLAHCWKTVSDFSKIQCYFKFAIPAARLKHCREHVYMLETWDSRIQWLEGKETPKCSQGDCLMCDVLVKVKRFLEIQQSVIGNRPQEDTWSSAVLRARRFPALSRYPGASAPRLRPAERSPFYQPPPHTTVATADAATTVCEQ